jgi:hypothetical protein
METLVKHPSTDAQGELLKQYCSEAESLIRSATTIAEAKKLGEQVCSKFQQECESTLVVNATRTFIDDIINRIFKVGV